MYVLDIIETMNDLRQYFKPLRCRSRKRQAAVPIHDSEPVDDNRCIHDEDSDGHDGNHSNCCNVLLRQSFTVDFSGCRFCYSLNSTLISIKFCKNSYCYLLHDDVNLLPVVTMTFYVCIYVIQKRYRTFDICRSL